jgi:hypothetical protein
MTTGVDLTLVTCANKHRSHDIVPSQHDCEAQANPHTRSTRLMLIPQEPEPQHPRVSP